MIIETIYIQLKIVVSAFSIPLISAILGSEKCAFTRLITVFSTQKHRKNPISCSGYFP